MKTNYVLVDYENVQPASLDVLNHEQYTVLIFVGASQTKISLTVATALQQMGTRAQYIQISGNGTNALDFHIAFTIGHLAAVEPDACFHIISNDAGFDPLLDYLKRKKIRAFRSCSVTDIPLVKAMQAVSAPDKIAVITTNLQQRGTSKPRTITTLKGTISALFQQKLSDSEIAALFGDLQKRGIIIVNDTKISYTLPDNVSKKKQT